jgi:hypothetical protein
MNCSDVLFQESFYQSLICCDLTLTTVTTEFGDAEKYAFIE